VPSALISGGPSLKENQSKGFKGSNAKPEALCCMLQKEAFFLLISEGYREAIYTA
jgi:hypothetical protein